MRSWTAAVFLFSILSSFSFAGPDPDPIDAAFRDPPARLRPFVRWWWNGLRVTEAGIRRELDVLKAAGIGGVTVVELFQERFLRTYVDWAHENGLLARIQAYGRETHVLEGSLQVDLPEGESWLWSNHDRIAVVPTVADKYVSSAAHLAGRSPVSFEAMTNAVPVFREMPEVFKLAMDLSALAGVLHPVLHGFSYSPPEAGFPGWVRFGSWFSAQNPWWPHVRRFTDYAARLTTVLTRSEFQASVALLGPRADEWARDGLLYQPFPEVSRPWCHCHLWQALQQAGYGTEFVSEGVLRAARVEDGRLRHGSRSYDALVLMDVVSLEPETAEAIARFGEAGGRVVFVVAPPDRAPGLKDAKAADRRVREAVVRLRPSPTGRAAVVPAPSIGLLPPGDYTRGALPDGARRELLRWAVATMARLGALWDLETGERAPVGKRASTSRWWYPPIPMGLVGPVQLMKPAD